MLWPWVLSGPTSLGSSPLKFLSLGDPKLLRQLPPPYPSFTWQQAHGRKQQMYRWFLDPPASLHTLRSRCGLKASGLQAAAALRHTASCTSIVRLPSLLCQTLECRTCNLSVNRNLHPQTPQHLKPKPFEPLGAPPSLGTFAKGS